MQTKQDSFLEFMGAQNTRFVIPVYQRVYSWTRHQSRELFVDIMRAGLSGSTHFLGTALFIESEGEQGGVRKLDVIDGQQRLATMTVLLTAFSRYLEEQNATAGGLDAAAVRERYLLCDGSTKIKLSAVDEPTLRSLVFKTPRPARPSERVLSNFKYFLELMLKDRFDAERFVRGLNQLVVIHAMLGPGDNPQMVFESLNSKGIPLTTADLVRNYILIGLSHEEQTRLYQEYWAPIERMFGVDPGAAKLNTGISMWLSLRFCKKPIPDKNETYNVFKAYLEDEFQGTRDELLDEMRSFCLVWAENFKFNEAKFFRSQDWAKGKPTTLVPRWGQFSGF